MRRLVSVLTTICILFSLLSLFHMGVFGEDTRWDGSVAEGFAGGSGTKTDPYQISSAAQLAYFANQVNLGRKFTDEYILLTCDITLNDERFSYDSEEDYVTISDGKNEAKIKREALLLGDTIDYSGKLHLWTPIDSDEAPTFEGIFLGENHSVSGLFVMAQDDGYAGLFGNTGGHIYSLRIENSLVAGGSFTGSLGGIVAHFYNIHCDAVVFGGDTAGGIAAKGEPFYGSFEGFVFGKNASGITNSGENVQYCINNGTVVAENDAFGIVGSGDVTYCYNTGKVSGQQAAGIGGSRTIKHCQNSGNITGRDNTAGISNLSKDASNCNNTGFVSGIDNVGGILTAGAATNCSNEGTVSGKHYVGGITAYGVAQACFNLGIVNGESYVGGIAAHTSYYGINQVDHVKQCYNAGEVSGTSYIGGIVGQANRLISHCYNAGSIVSDGKYAGGIGGVTASIEYSYNVGTVRGASNVGSITGMFTEYIHYCTYLENSAATHDGTIVEGIGTPSNVSYPSHLNYKMLTDAQMQVLEYHDFQNSQGLWISSKNETYPYPTLKGLHHGGHSYLSLGLYVKLGELNQISCENAISLTSDQCSCGLRTSFTAQPDSATHKFTAIQNFDATYHARVCEFCGTIGSKSKHIYGNLPSFFDNEKHYTECNACGQLSHGADHDAGKIVARTDGEYHYFSCEYCDYLIPVSHAYAQEPAMANESGHKLRCASCNTTSDLLAHVYTDKYVESNETGHCIKCDFCDEISQPFAHRREDGSMVNNKEEGQFVYRCADCDSTVTLPYVSSSEKSTPAIHLIVLYCIVGTVTGGLFAYGAVVLQDMKKTRMKNKK